MKIYRENVGQDGKYTDLNFATYIAFAMPIAIINLFLIWIVLSVIFLGRPKFHSQKRSPVTPTVNVISEESNSQNIHSENSNQHVAELLQRKLNELGKISFHEGTVIVLIIIAVFLWLFRDPRVIPGWISIFPDAYPRIGDSTVAIAILIMMFIIPKEMKYFRGGTKAFIKFPTGNFD